MNCDVFMYTCHVAMYGTLNFVVLSFNAVNVHVDVTICVYVAVCSCMLYCACALIHSNIMSCAIVS